MELPSDPPSRELVVVPPKAVRRFYEAIIMLDCVNQILRDHNRLPSAQPLQSYYTTELANGIGTNEGLFKFINKLAQVCDTCPGGATVTAFMILKEPDKVVYVFGSNNRTELELHETSDFVRKLLAKVRDGYDAKTAAKALYRLVLRDVLVFGLPRIKVYVRLLEKWLLECIASCEGKGDQDSLDLKQRLERLCVATRKVTGSIPGSPEYLKGVEALIGSIHVLKNDTQGFRQIESRIRAGQFDESPKWRELAHYIGRLASYHQAANVIVWARDTWPELFESFELRPIPSPAPVPNPMHKGSLTVHEIIGRMTTLDDTAKFRALAAELSRMSPGMVLDNLIQDVCQDRDFRPLVHCEVLLLDWLENTAEGARSDRFFRQAKYIGASKPTCRMCSFFFDSHTSMVKVRESHGNLYPRWRLPGMFSSQPLAAQVRLRKMMDNIQARVRAQVLRTMEERLTMTRLHDSLTQSSMPAHVHFSSRALSTLSDAGTGGSLAGDAVSDPSDGLDEAVAQMSLKYLSGEGGDGGTDVDGDVGADRDGSPLTATVGGSREADKGKRQDLAAGGEKDAGDNDDDDDEGGGALL